MQSSAILRFLGAVLGLAAPTASMRLYFWSAVSVPVRQGRNAGATCGLWLQPLLMFFVTSAWGRLCSDVSKWQEATVHDHL